MNPTILATLVTGWVQDNFPIALGGAEANGSWLPSVGTGETSASEGSTLLTENGWGELVSAAGANAFLTDAMLMLRPTWRTTLHRLYTDRNIYARHNSQHRTDRL